MIPFVCNCQADVCQPGQSARILHTAEPGRCSFAAALSCINGLAPPVIGLQPTDQLPIVVFTKHGQWTVVLHACGKACGCACKAHRETRRQLFAHCDAAQVPGCRAGTGAGCMEPGHRGPALPSSPPSPGEMSGCHPGAQSGAHRGLLAWTAMLAASLHRTEVHGHACSCWLQHPHPPARLMCIFADMAQAGDCDPVGSQCTRSAHLSCNVLLLAGSDSSATSSVCCMPRASPSRAHMTATTAGARAHAIDWGSHAMPWSVMEPNAALMLSCV